MKAKFLKQKDKVVVCKHRCCPPHYLPHKLPDGKPVVDEKCHFHSNKLSMLHHAPFCKILKCPHYNYMITKYRQRTKNKSLLNRLLRWR